MLISIQQFEKQKTEATDIGASFFTNFSHISMTDFLKKNKHWINETLSICTQLVIREQEEVTTSCSLWLKTNLPDEEFVKQNEAIEAFKSYNWLQNW